VLQFGGVGGKGKGRNAAAEEQETFPNGCGVEIKIEA